MIFNQTIIELAALYSVLAGFVFFDRIRNIWDILGCDFLAKK